MTSDASSDAKAYCDRMVKAGDEDRWLSAGYATPEHRRRLLALYAFHLELQRIPSAVSEPPLGEIRLQWWRDAFQEIIDGKAPRAHPVVEEVAAAGLVTTETMDIIDPAIDAWARPLYGEPFLDVDDLLSWLALAHGRIDYVAVELMSGDTDVAPSTEQVTTAGAWFSFARDGERYAPALADEITEQKQKRSAELRDAKFTAPTALAPSLLQFSLTKAYCKKPTLSPLAKRVMLLGASLTGRVYL